MNPKKWTQYVQENVDVHEVVQERNLGDDKGKINSKGPRDLAFAIQCDSIGLENARASRVIVDREVSATAGDQS